MTRQTQRQIVLDKLLNDGAVDNFWAFHNYILRLGAIIHDLRKEGYNIFGEFPEHSKNFTYTLNETKPTTTRLPEVTRTTVCHGVLPQETDRRSLDTGTVQLCLGLAEGKSSQLLGDT